MSNIKGIAENIASLDSLGTLVTTYQEIAAIRMRKVKKYVLRNREFLDGLSELYRRVHYSYYEKNEKEKQRLNEYMGKTEGTVSVLLSANAGLYGDIIDKTYRLFVEEVSNSTTDIVIVGRVGKAMYDSSDSAREYKYFTFSDSGVDKDALKEVTDYILSYSNILVYHGQFKTALIQKPQKTFLTGDALALQEEIEKSKEENERINVLFEPTMEEIVKFFETQIIGTVFEHILYESSLGKFASRMVSLERSSQNIDDELKKQHFVFVKEKHRESDEKQHDILSSLFLWS